MLPASGMRTGGWTTRPARATTPSARARDDIRVRVEQLVAKLVPAPAAGGSRWQRRGHQCGVACPRALPTMDVTVVVADA